MTRRPNKNRLMLLAKPPRQTLLRHFPTPDGQDTDTNQTREIAENTPAGTNIGAPVAASDTDVLTYSLEDGRCDAANFDINRATGQLDH